MNYSSKKCEWVNSLYELHDEVIEVFYTHMCDQDSVIMDVRDADVDMDEGQIFDYFLDWIDYGELPDYEAFNKAHISREEFFQKMNSYLNNQVQYFEKGSHGYPDKLVSRFVDILYSSKFDNNALCFYEKSEEEAWRLGILVNSGKSRHLISFAWYLA